MADMARCQAERYAEEAEALEEAKAEKKRLKDRRRIEYMRSLLSPQWKSNPAKKFTCSEKKKLTAIVIMDLVENGTFTNQQAEVHFIKLEKPDIETKNFATRRETIPERRTFTNEQAPNNNNEEEDHPESEVFVLFNAIH